MWRCQSICWYSLTTKLVPRGLRKKPVLGIYSSYLRFKAEPPDLNLAFLGPSSSKGGRRCRGQTRLSCGDTFSRRKFLKLRRIELRLTSSAEESYWVKQKRDQNSGSHFLRAGSNVETQEGGKLIRLPVQRVTGHSMSKVSSLLTLLVVKLRCLKFCTYPQETAEP